ncbi:MAG TPA: FAD-binding domain [Candidatus Sulfotelmatobacter sp.]|nr:FAD-binding domain [Candidatus Sulfotelmatobacter sp.]
MKILISGAGIAGPTLAYWLAQYGFEPTIIEKAPELRTGGYVIDFWGAGYDIADRMGLIPDLLQKGYRAQEARAVNDRGKKIASFSMASFARALQDRYVSLARGDLAASIYGKIAGKVETIFGESVCGIEQSGNSVRVSFEKSPPREFDLVMGADGLHSRVREIVFGADRQFEKYLGYKVAAFGVDGYRPRDELVYVMHTEVGQQVSRFAMHDDRTMFLFTFSDASPDIPAGLEGQKALLKARFAHSGWECPQIMEALDGVKELYFDRVSQIRMDPARGLWTKGRVTLIGDAAFCPSLLAGQGAALAMVSAYIVAGELHRANSDYRQAFTRYQELFAPFIAMKQKAALRFAGFFAPKSKLELFTRNRIMNLMRLPFVAELAMGRDMVDKIEIPDY